MSESGLPQSAVQAWAKKYLKEVLGQEPSGPAKEFPASELVSALLDDAGSLLPLPDAEPDSRQWSVFVALRDRDPKLLERMVCDQLVPKSLPKSPDLKEEARWAGNLLVRALDSDA